jgi:hypothetical protein
MTDKANSEPDLLRRLFGSEGGVATLLRSDLLKIAAAQPEEQAMSVIYDQLTKLLTSGLIEARYESAKNDKLTSITLTEKGKQALGTGRNGADDTFDEVKTLQLTQPRRDAVSLDDIMRDVMSLQKELPSFDVTLTISPRKQKPRQ